MPIPATQFIWFARDTITRLARNAFFGLFSGKTSGQRGRLDFRRALPAARR